MISQTIDFLAAGMRRLRTWAIVKRAGGCVRHGDGLHLGTGTVLWAPDQITIGKEVYVGKHVTVGCNCSIGDFVLIANRVGIVGRKDHDFRTLGVPVRHSPWAAESNDAAVRRSAVIEDDVWLGFGAIVLSGVRVGRGAVVAAGAVVFSDVGPYEIVSGNPAVKVGERMPENQRDAHEYSLKHGCFKFSERGTRYWIVKPKLPS